MKKRWAMAAAVGGLAAAGVAWQAVEGREDLRRFPPPGEMIPLPDGRRLHILRSGVPNGAAPTIVFEAALAASSIGWELVLPAVAEFAPVLAYDRAGLGWSDAPPRRVAGRDRTAADMVEDLRALLASAGVPRPVILAGHSYGGLLARLYAALYPSEVAGLALVDAAAPEQWTAISDRDQLRLKVGRHLARRGVWAARLGLARLVMQLALARGPGQPPDSRPSPPAADGDAGT
ncbi:MAG: alpha/beta fold hydrolase, partial [Terriglobales bacterium]